MSGEVADVLKAENAKMRAAIAQALRVQSYLCADKDQPWCDEECLLHRRETNDCEACDLIVLAMELGIEIDDDCQLHDM